MDNKKRIELRGRLEYPLAVGYAAFIKPDNKDALITSPVKHFLTSPSGTIYIETKNSHYVLLPSEKTIGGVTS